MRLLIDSQSLIWFVDQDHWLSPTAHAAITDPANDLLLSAASVWEIAIKVGLKKLTLSLPNRDWMEQAIADLGLAVLPITGRCRWRTSGFALASPRPVRPFNHCPSTRRKHTGC